jgi:hypothetical protein
MISRSRWRELFSLITVSFGSQSNSPLTMLANRMREGDKVTAAEVEVVMAELEASPGFSEWEAKELSAQAAPAKLKTACLVFAWLLA